ncbi:MAG TPA: hypothetical protein VE996_07075 [Terriglobales bacterium]|nr:hypothetical protein [Terriglobales bacterium]
MSAKLELERMLAARGFGATLPGPERTSPARGGAPVPAGGITELTPSHPAAEGAGATTCALRWAAEMLRARPEAAETGALPPALAWVDAAGAFDPESAARAGLELARLFWLRGAATPVPALLEAAHWLIHSGSFLLVVLDLLDRGEAELRPPPAAWFRLQRALDRCRRTALLVLAPRPLCGTSADRAWSVTREAVLWDERAMPLLAGARLRLESRHARRDGEGARRPPARAWEARLEWEETA